MNNPLPIKELHRIRVENYEATKHLSGEELIRRSNEEGRRLYEAALARKKAKTDASTTTASEPVSAQ